MKEHLNITFSFDDSYISQFLTVVNNIIGVELVDNVPLLRFFVCYNGSQYSMDSLHKRTAEIFPQVQFFFKHIPTEHPLLEKFLHTNYPYSTALQSLQTCSLYYRLFLDRIWPEVDGMMLQLDLDIMVKSPISLLFEQAEVKQNEMVSGAKRETTALFVSPYQKTDCYDLQDSTLPPIEVKEWKETNGKAILQHYVDGWFKMASPILQHVSEQHSEQHSIQCDILLKTMNRNSKTATHFNAGVLLFNLTEYRSKQLNKICEICILAQKHTRIFNHNDQGILNFVFFNNIIELNSLVPPLHTVNHLTPPTCSWNACDYGLKREHKLKNALNLIVNERFENGHIIHCNGPHKPWHETPPIPEYVTSLWKKFEIS